MKYFLLFAIYSLGFNLTLKAISSDCSFYSEALFEIIVKQQKSKIENFIQPVEHILQIMHWENTAENANLVDQMNKLLEEKIKESIDKVHDDFRSHNVKLNKAKFKGCEFNKEKEELLIYLNYKKEEYWIKVYTSFIYLQDRFKSQFDTTLTTTEKFNQRIIYKTEPKPLEPIALDRKQIEILKTCYSENEIKYYGNLDELITIYVGDLDADIKEIVLMCNTEKCRGKLVIFHLNQNDETCNIVLE